MKLLLISNSTQYGQGYLDHCADEIAAFLNGIRRLVFIPYALHDRDGYTAKARSRFSRLGIELDGIHAGDPAGRLDQAEAVFCGGGNTFRLLSQLYRENLLEPLRRKCREGMPYLGASAGINIAGPTIKTTNDMPIVQPPSFDALGLVPFNINPHYLDPDPDSRHQGETREERIREFHEINSNPVVGLREGAWLKRQGDRLTLGGQNGARVFRRGENAVEFPPGADLSRLLAAASG